MEDIKTLSFENLLFWEGATRGRELIIIGKNGEKDIFLLHLL